jgi:hypothetical protein
MRALAVLTATAGVALTAATSVAATPSVGPFNCGMTNRIAGHTWAIQASGVSCGTARDIVRDLASQTVPRSRIRKVGIFPGTHAGMRCFGGPTGQKPVSLTCATANAKKLVRAGRLR